MIILASKSPRRIKLMEDAGYEFIVDPSNIDESRINAKGAEELVKLLSEAKVRDVSKRHNYDDIVIGADTIVYFNDEILGKPKDENDAFNMLKKLSNNINYVYTGVAIFHRSKMVSFVKRAEVYMKYLSDEDIRDYIATKEPLDVAGSYAIQGKGSKLIDKFEGDFFTIVGLPLKDVKNELSRIYKDKKAI